MKKSTTLVILAVSALLATFALGIFVSRPAEAQLSRPSGSFPHQSELWQIQTNPDNWGSFNSPELSINGYIFDVAPDQLGRLPVLTDSLHRDNQAYNNLWMRGGDGFYRLILSASPGEGTIKKYSPGILLKTGKYALTEGGGYLPSPSVNRIALSGYRSMPY